MSDPHTFELEILSPSKTFYQGACRSLTLPVGDGMMGVMANHTPFSAAISDGEVRFTTPDGETHVCAVTRGIADMTDNRLWLLCESALSPDEIDAAAEQRAAEEAMREMQKKQSRRDFAVWQMTFRRAVNNLKVKGRSSDVNL